MSKVKPFAVALKIRKSKTVHLGYVNIKFRVKMKHNKLPKMLME